MNIIITKKFQKNTLKFIQQRKSLANKMVEIKQRIEECSNIGCLQEYFDIVGLGTEGYFRLKIAPYRVIFLYDGISCTLIDIFMRKGQGDYRLFQ